MAGIELSLILAFTILTQTLGFPLINEFEPNPDGIDPSTQTVELKGTPGQFFDGYFINVESDSGANPGDINNIVPVLTDNTFTGTINSDIDTNNDGTVDNFSVLGNVLDAIGIPDRSIDEAFLYGNQLGGTDFTSLRFGNMIRIEPELIFRDGITNSLYGKKGSEVKDVNVNLVNSNTFDRDPTIPTFGSVNPALRISIILITATPSKSAQPSLSSSSSATGTPSASSSSSPSVTSSLSMTAAPSKSTTTAPSISSTETRVPSTSGSVSPSVTPSPAITADSTPHWRPHRQCLQEHRRCQDLVLLCYLLQLQRHRR